MDSRKRSTSLIEARSLAMHAAIAAKIERQPKLLEIARNNLKRWRTRWENAVPEWHREWCIYDAFRLVRESDSDEEAAARRDNWLRENAEAISEYNDLISRLSLKPRQEL